MAKEMLGRLLGMISIVFAKEHIDQLSEVGGGRPRTSLLGMITGQEVLPEDKTEPAGRESVLGWLFRGEDLPLEPPLPSSGRTSFLGMLLSRERLPEDPAASGTGHAPGGRR